VTGSTTSPSVPTVAARTLRFVGRGAGTILLRWPGMLAVLVAYVAVATPTALAGVGYPQLLGAVAAGAVGVCWYASPLGRWEARRRHP
jgi:hypothetical protein